MRQFDTLSSDVEIGTPLTAETIILGLGAYFLPVNSLYNQKPAMQRGTRKPHGLKVRLYVACLIDFNKYLDSLPGEMLSEKIFITELNEITLNSMTISWSNQAYVKVFYYKPITLKKAVNMFERT